MLKIKLTRLGKKYEPRYRIVVNEARDKRDGSYVAKLGHYQPTKNPKELVLDIKAYEEWLTKGAQPTDTVAFLYDVAKKGKGFPEGKPKLSKKAKAKLEAEAEEKKAAAEAKKAEAEAPKEEPATEEVVETTTETTETPAEEVKAEEAKAE
ncbi:MAG: 30S ribosomal protein S16 [Pseudomonadales bacterium]|jgi:small subunit ribosomal protein S16|nr:30S ribosomal protein S16 [Pseudomonadales bacterium]